MKTAPRTILVSACLLGLNTRYDGEARTNEAVMNFLDDNNWLPVPVCPEQLGGMSTPRPAAEFKSGDGSTLLDGQGQLVSLAGEDVGSTFLTGAEQTTEIARLCNCSVALMKERSPSCGVKKIYRNGELILGSGVTTARLRRADIDVFCEEDLVAGHLPGLEVE